MEIRKTLHIDRAPDVVFKAFTDDIGTWWPLRRGYSFLGPVVETMVIEHDKGGRVLERGIDGRELVIGTVRIWKPPTQVRFTWKHPEWTAATVVDVRFTPDGGGTRVDLLHTGWEKLAKARAMRGDYVTGWDDVLAGFTKAFGSQGPAVRSKAAVFAGPTVTEALRAAMEAPTSDGLLVWSVGEGAVEAGVQVGDILVALGRTSLADGDYMAAHVAAHKVKDLTLAFDRAGERHTVGVERAWVAGTHFTHVRRGEEKVLRPPATSNVDERVLRGAPLDVWFELRSGGSSPKKIGFAHVTMSLRGKRITCVTESASDHGGLSHRRVETAVDVRERPKAISSVALDLRTGHRAEGRALARGTIWRTTAADRTWRIDVPADILPLSFLRFLPVLMPREDGACVRYTTLHESIGRIELPGAVLCRGVERIAVGRARVDAWRYDHVMFDVVGTVWIDDDGTPVRYEEGASTMVATSKDAALAAAPKTITPVTV